jgi:hypothetical protein
LRKEEETKITQRRPDRVGVNGGQGDFAEKIKVPGKRLKIKRRVSRNRRW